MGALVAQLRPERVQFDDQHWLTCYQLREGGGQALYLKIEPICDWLGLDYATWRQIFQDPLEGYAGKYRVEMPGPDGEIYRGFWVLRKAVIGWLNRIPPKTVPATGDGIPGRAPRPRALLFALRDRCDDILDAAFSNGVVASPPSRPEVPTPPVGRENFFEEMGRAVDRQEAEIRRLRSAVKVVEAQAHSAIDFHRGREGWFEVTGYWSMRAGLSLNRQEALAIGQKLAPWCRANGYPVDPKGYEHSKFGYVNAYPREALDLFYEAYNWRALLPHRNLGNEVQEF
jgi:hypothetical protein